MLKREKGSARGSGVSLSSSEGGLEEDGRDPMIPAGLRWAPGGTTESSSAQGLQVRGKRLLRCPMGSKMVFSSTAAEDLRIGVRLCGSGVADFRGATGAGLEPRETLSLCWKKLCVRVSSGGAVGLIGEARAAKTDSLVRAYPFEAKVPVGLL